MLARPISRVIGGTVRCLSTMPTPVATTSASVIKVPVQLHSRPKHKPPFKRASKLLDELVKEEYNSLRAGRQWPQVKAGDAVQIDHLPNLSSKEPIKIRGVVIANVKRASSSALTILNVEHGTPVERRIPLYSPMITNLTIVQKAFIHKGKKRVRRSKLYYLKDRKPEEFTVPYEVVVSGKKKTNKK
jgi:large subunit ribosomal protein L19